MFFFFEADVTSSRKHFSYHWHLLDYYCTHRVWLMRMMMMITYSAPQSNPFLLLLLIHLTHEWMNGLPNPKAILFCASSWPMNRQNRDNRVLIWAFHCCCYFSFDTTNYVSIRCFGCFCARFHPFCITILWRNSDNGARNNTISNVSINAFVLVFFQCAFCYGEFFFGGTYIFKFEHWNKIDGFI